MVHAALSCYSNTTLFNAFRYKHAYAEKKRGLPSDYLGYAMAFFGGRSLEPACKDVHVCMSVACTESVRKSCISINKKRSCVTLRQLRLNHVSINYNNHIYFG